MTEKIRIKDIAIKSGVSVGTVDRVLHERPNVSKEAREKVEKILKELNYQPNMYASALAYNKSYTFHLLMPQHDSEAYWNEIEEGALQACKMRSDFHINVEIIYYERYNTDSYHNSFKKILQSSSNGVIIVPSELKTTQTYTDILHERNIPFILLDSYIAILKPLSFFGQDSFRSGYFAARMLMLLAANDKEIMLMKQTKNGKTASKQQDDREIGFRNYMQKNFPDTKINVIDLPLDKDKSVYDNILEKFFNEHPDTHHCITMSSKAHIVGDFILRTKRANIQIMGYDMVAKNAECLKQGSISFLIAQHAYMQGYNCVDTLFKAIVLKHKIAPINYMPIELLTKENVDFYRRTQL